MSLVAILFYPLSVLFGSCCLSEFTLAGLEKERAGAAFSSLRRWLSGWKSSEVILSHTTNQLQFYKQLLHAQFCLDRNIMVHTMTNIPARSGCGLINAEALLGRDTTSVQTNYNRRSQHY